MASLKDIRRRIGSVKNTQQITKAMKMVSAAKLRRAQDLINGARPFADKVEELTSRILRDLLKTKTDETQKILHPLLRQEVVSNKEDETQKPKAYLIAVSSDKGLCGAYNTNILKFALKEAKALVDEGRKVQFYFVGKRAADAFTKRGFKGEFLSDVWAGKFTTTKSDKVAALLTNKFLKGEVSSVVVFYTQFKTVLSQFVLKKQLLPLELNVKKSESDVVANTDKQFLYEPTQKTLLASLLPGLVKTSLYRMLADSLASEYGARMTAMDNATRNAGDMISRLSLEANRVRQASITKELMEIVGGAEALKG